MQTLALQFTAPGKVEWVPVDVPPPRDGQVLASTLYSGISSGTEMLAYRGEIDPELPLDETIGTLVGDFSFPFRYGYSCVGRVEESRSRLGRGSMIFALHPHQGAFVADAAVVVPVDDVDPRVATLYPLLEAALQMAVEVEAGEGDVAVVLGLGAVGILAGALIARTGARALGVDPLHWRRAAAATLGVEAVTPSDARDRVGERSAGRGADVVIDASGNPSALSMALDLLAHEGTALVASWFGTKSVSLPLGGSFHRRRLTIRSTQVSSIPARLSGRWTIERRRRETAALLRELPLAGLATHEFSFTEAAAAYEAIARNAEGLIHVALSYDAKG